MTCFETISSCVWGRRAKRSTTLGGCQCSATCQAATWRRSSGLISCGHKPAAKQSDIYSLQVDRLRHLDQEQIAEEIKHYSRLSGLLRLMRHPEHEDNHAVRRQLERLQIWGLVAADPLVLHLLRLRQDGLLDSDATARALHLTESFMVRRVLIGASPNALNRIMNRAALEVGETNVLDELHRYFSTGRKFFATDAQIAEAVTTKPFYYLGRPNQRKAILGWLEESTPLEVANRSLRAKENVDIASTTIEHVMPQSLTRWWRDQLSSDLADFTSVDDLHDALVHTMANLTLTGYNSELSNDSYPKKRELLERSGLRMNGEIARYENWGRSEILERGRILADRIAKQWSGPLADVDAVDPGTSWRIVGDLVSAIPAGRWTTYGDVAAVAGHTLYRSDRSSAVRRFPGHGVFSSTPARYRLGSSGRQAARMTATIP